VWSSRCDLGGRNPERPGSLRVLAGRRALASEAKKRITVVHA
jgi:hypothetical protein